VSGTLVVVNERRVVLAVVVLLGLIALTALVGTIYLLALDKDTSAVAVVAALASGPAGALAGLLASTRSVDLEALGRLSDNGSTSS
jgi:hypothetical protein